MKVDLENWEILVLCEDKAHFDFIRFYLQSLGATSRKINPYPQAYTEDRAFNNASVLKYYPNAVHFYRERTKKTKILLVVMIDADERTVAQRYAELNKKLISHELCLLKRTSEEYIFIFVPDRNIETWFYYLDTFNDIKENIDYKAGKYQRIKSAAISELARKLQQDICSTNILPNNFPSSLKDACDEINRKLKYEENSEMETQHLLFELGSEELPPKTLLRLSNALLDGIVQGLNAAELSFTAKKAFATPRRLAVLIENLASSQPDKTVEKRGPAIQAAFDKDGNPSKAALGFAASCGTAFENLQRLKTDKGEWLSFTEEVKGQTTEALIPDIIRTSIANLPIAKRMRWGSFNTEFVRPVHWAVLLYGSKVIETEILGLKTDRITRGHRFHSVRPHITIKHPKEYEDILHIQGKVIADFEKRKSLIRYAAHQAAQSVGGVAHIEEDLLEEITALNEYPQPIMGSFDSCFLALPKEVLITTMQTNQKYFPVKNIPQPSFESGIQEDLLPYFITFSNIESTKPKSIKQGNERVVTPRLADAEFFWKQDLKQPLEERALDLANIVFQEKLGSMADKTHRLIKLAEFIAQELNEDIEMSKRAALLSKADLLTSMVGEFGNLQGIMGRYYALAQDELLSVAWAIEEQYYPKQSGSLTAKSPIGRVLAIAEKIDTLTGIFSAGLIPTGDKDPYALRRAALGALRTIIENNLTLDIRTVIDYSLNLFSHAFDIEKTRSLVTDFVFERLKGYCLDKGYTADEFEAVMTVKPQDPLDFMQRLAAVKTFRQLPEAASLAAANKRIRNILKKSDAEPAQEVGALVEEAELRLLASAKASASDITPLLAQRDYAATLARLASLRDDVDKFFDDVMVNCEDPQLRANRLALLNLLSEQFLTCADISKLQS